MIALRAAALLVALVSAGCSPSGGSDAPIPGPWPPVTGQAYPDIQLLDHRGEPSSLRDLAGKVLLVEPVAMSCSLCQAYSGGGEAGAVGDVSVAQLPSFEQLLRDAGVDPEHPDLVFVQMVLFSLDGERAPTVDEAAVWAEHFGLDKRPRTLVLTGDARYADAVGESLYPGFHLVDRDFVLQAWTSGHAQGGASLKGELLPKLAALLGKASR